jgi:hypothetical protein
MMICCPMSQAIHRASRIKGPFTPLQAAAIVPNTSYNVKLVVYGDNSVRLEAWVNGVQKIVFDDSSASQITAGVPGIEN